MGGDLGSGKGAEELVGTGVGSSTGTRLDTTRCVGNNDRCAVGKLVRLSVGVLEGPSVCDDGSTGGPLPISGCADRGSGI